jgi:hypothetical protein
MNNDKFKGFFDWLAKPMNQDDIDAWYLANNIIPEYTELFRDFCMGFIKLLKETYLGDDDMSNTESRIVMSEKQKKEHFKWCWNRVIQNFTKENINFIFTDYDYVFFESFFYDIFYKQEDVKMKESIDNFFSQLFDDKYKKAKSDIEVFTDIYKAFERSLKLD